MGGWHQQAAAAFSNVEVRWLAEVDVQKFGVCTVWERPSCLRCAADLSVCTSIRHGAQTRDTLPSTYTDVLTHLLCPEPRHCTTARMHHEVPCCCLAPRTTAVVTHPHCVSRRCQDWLPCTGLHRACINVHTSHQRQGAPTLRGVMGPDVRSDPSVSVRNDTLPRAS